jgi:YidC/Oxa1 family membrane protein insertase
MYRPVTAQLPRCWVDLEGTRETRDFLMLAFAPLDGAMGAAYPLVTVLGSALDPVVGAGTAAAIAVFTIGVRLLLSPLSYAQAKGDRRRRALAPRIAQLQHRHRKDPARLAAELSALYRAEAATPYGGCLLALVQMPFFLIMYRLFTSATVASGPNRLLAEPLYGVPLGTHLTSALAAGVLSPPLLVFATLFVILAVLAWLSSRRMARAQAPRLLRLMPYGTLLAASAVPLAAGIYLATTMAWTALEFVVLRR